MKGLSVFILAGVMIAGAGALAYKVYKEKQAKKEPLDPEEPVVTVEEEDVVSEDGPDDIPDDVFEDPDTAEKPDEE